MELNIKMLTKEAIIASKAIFLPLNFNWETDWEQSVNSLLMPEIKLLKFLVELKYLGEDPPAVCKPIQVWIFSLWHASTILPY